MVKDITHTKKILTKHLKRLSKANFEEFTAALCVIEAPPGGTQIKMVRLEGKAPKEIAEIIISSYTIRYGPKKVRQALKNISQNQIRIDLEKELRGGKSEKETPNKVKAAPRTDGGRVSAADQKKEVGAGKGSKSLKSEQPGEDTKPKGGRKVKTEPIMKVQTSGGAAGLKRKREEKRDKDVTPKKTRKQLKTNKKHFVTENRKDLIKLITPLDPVLDDLLDEEILTQEHYDIVRKKDTNQDRMRELFGFVTSWGPKEMNKFQKILKKHNPVPIKNLIEKTKQKK